MAVSEASKIRSERAVVLAVGLQQDVQFGEAAGEWAGVGAGVVHGVCQ